jgi:hypothetical protein
MLRKMFAIAVLAGLPALGLAATTLNVQPASKAGVTPSRLGLSSTETYKARNNGRTLLLFEKTGSGNCTVTIVTPGTAGGLAISDQTVVVPASSGDKVIGPFPTALFNDANGDLSFSVSDTAGLSVAVIKL